MRREDLVGVWESNGEEIVRADGSVVKSPARSGRIMYMPDGRMSVVSTPASRPALAENTKRMDLDGASAEGRADAAAGCVCYAGRFEVKDGAVHHHVEVALNPNLIGTTVFRRIELAGDDLALCSLPDPQGTFFRIRWKRMPKS